MITVCAGVAAKNKKIFIARRKYGSFKGYWEFPGGKLEKNETPRDCLIREIEEELCVDAEILNFIKETIHEYSTKTIKLLFFNIRFLNDNMCLNAHDKIKWETPENLKNYKFPDADQSLIKLIETKPELFFN